MFPPYRKTHLKLSNQALMPVLELGHGQTSVVIIRGADDGIRSAREFARGWAWLYRHRARGQTIHLISRREDIPAGYSIEDHTRDYIEALDRLQLGPVILECNSAGGFTGPQIAAQRPELVHALVLACTAHRMDAAATETVGQWLKMIDGIRWSDFAWDAAEKISRRAAGARWAAPLLKPIFGLLVRPKNPDRIRHLLQGVLGADNSAIFKDIACPTLVFGGTEDPIFDIRLQHEMAAAIPGSRFVSAEGYLHAADFESPDYVRALDQLIADIGPGVP